MRKVLLGILAGAGLFAAPAGAKPVNIAATQVEIPSSTPTLLVAARPGRKYVSLSACRAGQNVWIGADSSVTQNTGFLLPTWLSGAASPPPMVIDFEGAVYGSAGTADTYACVLEVY